MILPVFLLVLCGCGRDELDKTKNEYSGKKISCSDFYLVRNGQDNAEFILPSNSPFNVTEAFKEFNEGVKKITGTELTAVQKPSGKKARVLVDIQKMKFSEDDAFTISFPDTQTMKISCSERSFRWALAHILKDHGNVTFLFSRNAFADYPKSPDLKVPVKTFHDAPSFNILRTGFGSKSWKNYFCTRKKFKGWDCHTVSKLSFPWKDYKLGLWPEEVLPLIGGKRIAPSKSNYSYWNPCYSSKSSRKVAIKNILKILDADPDRMISNDFRGQPPLNSCKRQ